MLDDSVNTIVARQDFVTVYLDPEIKRKFKSFCALEGLDMSSVCAEFVEQWVKERDRSAKDKKS